MTAPLPSPQPPQASVGFYRECAADADLFAGLCELLLDMRATPTGARVAPAGQARAFERISDLAPELSLIDLAGERTADERLRGLVGGEAPEQRVLQAGFTARPVGAVLATYESAAEPQGRHPVAVVASAERLSPPGGGGGRAGRAVARWLKESLSRGCDCLDPLYAAIIIEGSLPPPALLSADSRLGTELFVANRLLAAAPGLDADLTALFGPGAAESWPGGLFFSGWGWFNQAGRTIPNARAVERSAADRLARAIARAGFS
jgi:hypothetical protein